MRRKDMKEYRIWQAMKARCYAPSQRKSGYYQQDNIKVCDRWRCSFDNFIEDMGLMPNSNYSIERIDNFKDYCPENCKWIPIEEQKKNRRNVPQYSYNGKTMCLKDWSKELGIPYEKIRGRIRRGISFEDAIKDDLYDRQVEIDGKSKTVSEWCEFYNLNKGDVYSRIHRGWSKQDAILKSQEDIVQH